MDRFVTIPREALDSLLKASGSPLTPEQYLANLREPTDEFRKYRSRAIMAAVSKYCLLVAAVLSVLFTCTPWGFGFESVLISILLVVITYFEFRVHSAFRNQRPEAPIWGFRNQAAFSAIIVIYCFYRAFTPTQLPSGYREMMDPDTARILRIGTFVIYMVIAVVAGLSQFGLAWFYRTARTSTRSAQ